jgi:peptidoglycan hydrolase-like amidase
LWAGYENRSPKWQKALKKTNWEVLFYKWEILKSAYFSCSNWRTKTLKEANWQSNYFKKVEEVYKSVPDEFWKDLRRYKKWLCWHWVWLSWFWAENLARKWWSYKKILYYYYDWVEIKKIK